MKTATALAGFFIATIPPAHADEQRLAEYNRCYLEQLDLFKPLCEPVEMVAIAIVQGCPNEFTALREAMMRSVGYERGLGLADHMISIRKEQAIASLLRHRLQHPCR